MKEKQTMVFRYEWISLLNAMESDTAMKILNELMICDTTGEESEFAPDNPLVSAVFKTMQAQVLDNRRAYEEKCNKNKTNGSLGGRPKANGLEENPEKPNGYFEKAKKPDNDNDYDNDNDKEIYTRIISQLNEKCGTNYRASSKKTQSLIRARLNEGFSERDFYKVIENKSAEWSGDAKMEKFLRPETLFGTKFESYLNQKNTPKVVKNKFTDFSQRVYEDNQMEQIERAMTALKSGKE